MTPRTAARVCPVLVVFGLGAGMVMAQAGGGAPPPPPPQPAAPTPAAAPGGPALPPGVQQIVDFEQMRKLEPQIRAFADDRFAKLAGDDLAARTTARKEIAAAVARQLQPNPLFLSTFGKAVNDAALASLKGAPADARLNVAISVAKVAEPMTNASLAPVVQQMLGDEYEPVVLWGVKAAGPVIASSPQPALLQAVSKAVDAQKDSGPIADEAYHAVVGGQARPGIAPTFARQVLPIALELFRNRVAQYRTALPADAGAENRATAFFSNPRAWEQMTPQEQGEVVQLMLELASLAADHFVAGQRDPATPVLRGTGSSLSVISSYVKNSGGQAAGLALSRVSPGTNPTEVKRLATAVADAVRAQPPFNQTKPPTDGAAAAALTPAAGARGATTTATAP